MHCRRFRKDIENIYIYIYISLGQVDFTPICGFSKNVSSR